MLVPQGSAANVRLTKRLFGFVVPSVDMFGSFAILVVAALLTNMPSMNVKTIVFAPSTSSLVRGRAFRGSAKLIDDSAGYSVSTPEPE